MPYPVGLERFQEMIVPITEALLTIKDNEDGFWDSSSAAASGLSVKISLS